MEHRYIVLKRKDAFAALTVEEIRTLHKLTRKVDLFRRVHGKEELQCLVVEHDWPEYGPTSQAILHRVAASDETLIFEGMADYFKAPQSALNRANKVIVGGLVWKDRAEGITQTAV